ncbi:hypothetical protein [Rhodococcoides corynebacterioides]|uniref:Tetratricopeptide repeat protein n=1 Tax=Rhodococcoides corynebacterioides TaxID=53972 RepID=A0ABS7P7E2_9NOCA|nr:hypothetical protein [Rhodococcus corynebacterioides]MBY6368352.1 hypothetical protein [Rhodococcus corynebacterioides]MBY6409251.1 hypothetical protein [Rhodococcus corynebacterioides]
MTAPDPTMEAITAAVMRGRGGDVAGARSDLEALWSEIGVRGDEFHRCTLAHYLADLYDDAAVALIWDVRALDAADALDDDRAQQHHASLQVAAFYPSLHLNLADNLRRLGSFPAAADHLDRAEERLSALPDDAYGEMIRSALTELRQAVAEHRTERLSSGPDS